MYLVVSFISETRFLAMNMEDELEEIEIEGFDAQIQTLFCQNAINDMLIQVPFLMNYLVYLPSLINHKSTTILLCVPVKNLGAREVK